MLLMKGMGGEVEEGKGGRSLPKGVSPSLLSADFLQLGEAVACVNRSTAQYLHLDVMDGLFVPNISFGFPVIERVGKVSEKPLDVHLMIEQPERYLERFAKAGAHLLTVHWEASVHLVRTLQEIRRLGMRAGVALNPHTPVEWVEDSLDYLDLVLVMSVNPGFGGQHFLDSSLRRVERLRGMITRAGANVSIEVDGGINASTASRVQSAGADIVVAGSAVFGAADPVDAIARIGAPWTRD